jgi:hypothetical protein
MDQSIQWKFRTGCGLPNGNGNAMESTPGKETASALHAAPRKPISFLTERPMPTTNQWLTRGIVMGIVAKVPQGLLLYIMSDWGVFIIMGVGVNVPLNIVYSIKHLALGGVFGALFAAPVLLGWPNWLRGILAGLAHAAVVLFLINPFIDDVGFMGIRDLGPLFPAVSVVANVVWGVLAGVGVGLWNRLARPSKGRPSTAHPAKHR